ncbi:MAG: hypothetical protein M3Z24_10465, partial [Chloroflexota bacterium]|nr:hypothetical protein [Chloroflexota bacterium]
MFSQSSTMQLFLKMGSEHGRLKPAPYDIINALDKVEVQDNIREQEDGFQIQFTLGKRMAQDQKLPERDLLSVGARVVIVVRLKGRNNVLISGVITYRQLIPVHHTGSSTFTITGKSVTHLLDHDELNDAHERLSASSIVQKLVRKYAGDGFSVNATRTQDQSLETQRIPHQA